MKKYLKILMILPAIPFIAFAQATDTIQLPSGFTANVLGISTDTLSNFAPWIELILGILLAVLAVGALIHFLRG